MGGVVGVRVLHNLPGCSECIAFHIARRLVSRQLQCEVDSLRWFYCVPNIGMSDFLYLRVAEWERGCFDTT